VHPVARGVLSVVLGAVVGFPTGFLLSPDPTGLTPVVVGAAATAVTASLVHRRLGRDA